MAHHVPKIKHDQRRVDPMAVAGLVVCAATALATAAALWAVVPYLAGAALLILGGGQ